MKNCAIQSTDGPQHPAENTESHSSRAAAKGRLKAFCLKEKLLEMHSVSLSLHIEVEITSSYAYSNHKTKTKAPHPIPANEVINNTA